MNLATNPGASSHGHHRSLSLPKSAAKRENQSQRGTVATSAFFPRKNPSSSATFFSRVPPTPTATIGASSSSSIRRNMSERLLPSMLFPSLPSPPRASKHQEGGLEGPESDKSQGGGGLGEAISGAFQGAKETVERGVDSITAGTPLDQVKGRGTEAMLETSATVNPEGHAGPHAVGQYLYEQGESESESKAE